MIDSNDREVEAHLVLLALGAVTLLGLSIYHVVILHNPFDPDPFGRGLGYLFTGGGAAAWGQGMQRKAQGDSNGSDQ
ncbi:MAG: hypothetical protein P4M15_13470 [Alphaproteobacteria bacterium]|nr:hypothetical protein [Alphaproteobacteria bacterium]